MHAARLCPSSFSVLLTPAPQILLPELLRRTGFPNLAISERTDGDLDIICILADRIRSHVSAIKSNTFKPLRFLPQLALDRLDLLLIMYV